MVKTVPSSRIEARFSTVGVTVGVDVVVTVGVAVLVAVAVDVLVAAGVGVTLGAGVDVAVGTGVRVAVATNGSDETAKPGETVPIATPNANGMNIRSRRRRVSGYLQPGTSAQLYRSYESSSGAHTQPTASPCCTWYQVVVLPSTASPSAWSRI